MGATRQLQFRPGHRGDGELARSLPQASPTNGQATYQEKKTGGQTGYIFAVSLLFVILVLAALYESWAMPIAILLVIPFGCSARFGAPVAKPGQQRLCQIGLIMLIGLAKNPPRRIRGIKREQGKRSNRPHWTAPSSGFGLSDDLVRFHPWFGPTRPSVGRGRRSATGARNDNRVWHAHGSAGRRVLHSSVLRARPAAVAAVAVQAGGRRAASASAGLRVEPRLRRQRPTR